MFNISVIEKPDLHKLEPLLRSSFGEGFDLQDELDYFEYMPYSSWYYTEENGVADGFIRCFRVEENLYKMELSVLPSPGQLGLLKALLSHFRNYNSLGPEARVRFEVGESNRELLNLLTKVFPAHRVETFLQMRKVPTSYDETLRACKLARKDFFERVKQILSVLKSYSVEDLEILYANKELHVYCEADLPVAALHLSPDTQDGCELITLATDAKHLRCGYATELLKTTIDWASSRFSVMTLKVNEDNKDAINLYKKMGFEVAPEHAQKWWVCVSKI